ncbi:MAG: FAD-dependent oxidoreductase [Bacteroidota bacterium]|nr:FAD-dependent oxidoreductase [Bacteroidota bacterium]
MSLKHIIKPFSAWSNLFRDPVTVKDPLNDRPGAARYRGFHQNDIESCIGCGACSTICENEAISMVPVDGIETKEGDSGLRPLVDYGRCCWCALCVDVCPTESLKLSNHYTWVDEDPEVFKFIPGVDKMPWDEEPLGWKRPEDNYELNNFERIDMQELEPETRDKSFIEIVKGYSKQEAQKEADRCINCGLCVSTCPAHMGIPEYIAAVREDNINEGFKKLYETNPLPEICGRICTHKCETVCAMGHRGDPLSIRWLKRYIADQVESEDYKKVLELDSIENKDQKVAIIGSGPAGLSAAYYLRRLGYQIKIFEALPQAGGMMRYGIPEYRLPYDQIDNDINFILELGAEIQYNTRIGKDISMEELEKSYDAVYSATGLHEGRSTRIPGADHKNVYMAADLLRDITLGNEVPVMDKVVVIGGGNVAMDITRSMARLQNQKFGKVDVLATSLESEDIMPADREEVVEAREEKAVIDPGWGPTEILIEEGKLKGLKVQKCLSVFGEDGRFAPKFDENQTKFFPADMIIESIGQGANLSYIPQSVKDELEYTDRGRIKVDKHFQSSVKWLFFGGDIIEGPDVIHGIANGHKAAIGIDKFIQETIKQ